VNEGIQTHQAFGEKIKWKLGNPLWMLFMPKKVYSFVRFGMVEGLLIQVFI